MKFFLSVVLVSLCLAWHCNAHAQNGPFVFVESGAAKQSNIPDQYDLDADDMKYTYGPVARIGFGGNHDFEYFDGKIGLGTEVAAGWYGNVKYLANGSQVAKATFTTLEFLPILTFHFNKLDLFGKFGGLRNSININSAKYGDNRTFNRPEGGAGLVYNFTGHIAATCEYLHIFGDNNDKDGLKSPTLDLVLVGAKVSFF